MIGRLFSRNTVVNITIGNLRNENPGISSAFVIGWLWAKSVDSRFIFSEDCLRRAVRGDWNPNFGRGPAG